MNKIAMLGIGAMGERMAKSLLRAGYQLAVYNRTPARTESLCSAGATGFSTPREAAAASDVIISMVTDDNASRDVWEHGSDSALAGVGSGQVCVEMSTVTPDRVRKLAARVHAAGAGFIDAPVVGSRPQAESGQLVILAGGDRQVVRQIAHVFSAMAAATHHMGPVGAGATAKLVVNFLYATQVAAVAELLALSRKGGMEDATIASLLGALPVTSPAAAGALKLMSAGTYAPMFPIDLVVKDLGYFAALAEGARSSAPVAAAIRRVYENASAAGFGADNIHGVVQAYAT